MEVDKSNSKTPELEFENRVELVYKGIEDQDPSSILRIRKQLPSLTEIELPGLNIDHVKTAIAREAGFKDWQMAMDVFAARLKPGDNFGDFWYTLKTDVLLNYWCHDYEESLDIHIENGGYLLPYRKQFVVVQKTYIEILGMNPNDSAWETINYNLVFPADLASYRQLVMSRLLQIDY